MMLNGYIECACGAKFGYSSTREYIHCPRCNEKHVNDGEPEVIEEDGTDLPESGVDGDGE